MAREAVTSYAAHEFSCEDLVLVDLEMPGVGGELIPTSKTAPEGGSPTLAAMPSYIHQFTTPGC